MNNPYEHFGLFLCKCGNNVAQFVDLERLAAWAGEQKKVGLVVTHDLLCSPAGKQFIKDTIGQKRITTMVIAACSPKMHEKTFREIGATQGLNGAQVHMANIREHVAWVTADKEAALEKTQALISAALRRCLKHESLEPKFMECNTDIVVIGGGIAGIEAALMAAKAGRQVTIIEKEISLGGSVIKTEEVAPDMECAPCLLAPRLSAVRDNKNIKVVTNACVSDVIGFFGNFLVKATRKARYVTEACIGCEACFDACPVSVPSAFHLQMGNRKAVYTAFPGSVPAAATIDRANCRHYSDAACSACKEACSFGAINFDDQDSRMEFKAGAVILATGHADPLINMAGILGVEKPENVYTMPQFERLAASNGPTGGELLLADKNKPASLMVIHCAGSLKPDGLAYCSGVCCMTALKAGELFRKKIKGGTVTNIHDRLVLQGPGAEAFFNRQKEEGTLFVKTADLGALKITRKGGKISASGKDLAPIEADMAVLSTGMGPSADAEALARICGLDCNAAGFFKPDHAFLHATGASIDGIYGAGSCASPCDIGAAVTRAQAAAGDAVAKLIPGKRIELEMMTSHIDENLCAGCRMCISVCPYKAIVFDADKKVSVVNEAVCRGCGTCAATCPGRAIAAKHFTDVQITEEIEGVLHG